MNLETGAYDAVHNIIVRIEKDKSITDRLVWPEAIEVPDSLVATGVYALNVYDEPTSQRKKKTSSSSKAQESNSLPKEFLNAVKRINIADKNSSNVEGFIISFASSIEKDAATAVFKHTAGKTIKLPLELANGDWNNLKPPHTKNYREIKGALQLLRFLLTGYFYSSRDKPYVVPKSAVSWMKKVSVTEAASIAKSQYITDS
jgi:hypothetical protein